MFKVYYSNFNNQFSIELTRDQAEIEIIDAGYPITRTEIKSVSDLEISSMLKEIYNP